MPVYSDGEKYYFHKLNRELVIQGFEPFEKSEFLDSITEIEPNEVVDNLSFIVFKYDNSISFGNKTEVFNSISYSIFNNEFESKAFIENFRHLFKHVLLKSMLECNRLISVKKKENKIRLDRTTKRYLTGVFDLRNTNVHYAVKKSSAVHKNYSKEAKLIFQSKCPNESIMKLSFQLSSSSCRVHSKSRGREQRDNTKQILKKRRFEIERKY